MSDMHLGHLIVKRVGAKQPVIKAHGSSKAKGIKNAIRQAKICVENDLCGTMQAALDELKPSQSA